MEEFYFTLNLISKSNAKFSLPCCFDIFDFLFSSSLDFYLLVNLIDV